MLSAVKDWGRLGCEEGDVGGIGDKDEVLEVFVTASILFSVNNVKD